MLFERAEMLIAPGKAEDFQAMMECEGLPLLAALPGANSVKMGRGVENPDKFMLLLNWNTMDDHTAFTKSPSFPVFLSLMQPYSVGGGMEHFEF